MDERSRVVEPTLSAKQERAADLLALGNSQTDTAKALNVSRQTIWEWQKDPEFRACIRARRSEARNLAHAKILGLLPKAMDVVQQKLSSDSGLSAATLVFRLAGVLGSQGSAGDDISQEADPQQLRWKRLLNGMKEADFRALQALIKKAGDSLELGREELDGSGKDRSSQT